MAPSERAHQPDLRPGLLPLSFLIGTWRGEGVGGYPSIEDFRYGQELTFSHAGKPMLSYTSRSWHLDDDRPLAVESGYWRPQPDGSLEVVLAHGSGIVEVSVGSVTGTRIELATDVVARTSSAKEVAALKRLYGLVEGSLMYAVDMSAVGQGWHPHLSARLDRVAS